jgi:hypothetical protein
MSAPTTYQNENRKNPIPSNPYPTSFSFFKKKIQQGPPSKIHFHFEKKTLPFW